MLFVPRSFGARPLYVAIVSVLLLCRSLPASAAGTGQISGTVTEEKTGAAIAGAGVDAVSPVRSLPHCDGLARRLRVCRRRSGYVQRFGIVVRAPYNRLRQPWSRITRPPGSRRAQTVEAEPGNRRMQERAVVRNFRRRYRRVPADVGILNDVFRLPIKRGSLWLEAGCRLSVQAETFSWCSNSTPPACSRVHSCP